MPAPGAPVWGNEQTFAGAPHTTLAYTKEVNGVPRKVAKTDKGNAYSTDEQPYASLLS